MREFVAYLDGVLARLDQGAGWCAVFWQRDPDGMQACLDGREVPPWDVVEALLQDLAAAYGPEVAHAEADRARPLHAAAQTAYDARPGGRDALGDRFDVMLREQRYAAERQAELGRRLAGATTQEEADAIRLDLAWARDDHERAVRRCAELQSRMAELDHRTMNDQARAIRRGQVAEGGVPRGAYGDGEGGSGLVARDPGRHGREAGRYEDAVTGAGAHEAGARGAVGRGAVGGGADFPDIPQQRDAAPSATDAEARQAGHAPRWPDRTEPARSGHTRAPGWPDDFGAAPRRSQAVEPPDPRDPQAPTPTASPAQASGWAEPPGDAPRRPGAAETTRPGYGPHATPPAEPGLAGRGPGGRGSAEAAHSGYGPHAAAPGDVGAAGRGPGRQGPAEGGHPGHGPHVTAPADAGAAGRGPGGKGSAEVAHSGYAPYPVGRGDVGAAGRGPGRQGPAEGGHPGHGSHATAPADAGADGRGPGGQGSAEAAHTGYAPHPVPPDDSARPGPHQYPQVDSSRAAYAPYQQAPGPLTRPERTSPPDSDPPHEPTPAAPPPEAAAPKRKRRRGGARFAGMAEEDGAPVVVPPAAVPDLPSAPAAKGRTPRGARFAGAAEVPKAGSREPAEPLDAAARRETAETVATLVRLRSEGRTGEAHGVLVELAHWPADRFPLLAAEFQHAGLGADWATLLWEAASLPADRLVAAADALVAAGRGADGEQILRQGVARPAGEIGAAVLGLVAEGRRREVTALLDAYVRVRAPEEAARSAEPGPGILVPLLLAAARGVSDERHWDLVHALRVAGFSA
ncbi:hypothetical protein AQI94_27185 [Streptomyces pseudovenezuelae]|uniref:UL36 very large tegument protein n=3 Tax=Streptomyces TaxID=1883 RepID=A0A101N2V2_9ACTN|nr:hypothetical protein AQI94_27185 [Streptomyces pseudovenezuelae]